MTQVPHMTQLNINKLLNIRALENTDINYVVNEN